MAIEVFNFGKQTLAVLPESRALGFPKLAPAVLQTVDICCRVPP